MARKYDLISELYNRTCKTVVSSPENWQAFLTSACRNYKLRFDEQLLVFAQRPDATAVLEIERWNKSFGRWVNKGATGIAVFDDVSRSHQWLIHYFDISDTHESRYSRPVPIWSMKPEYEEEIIETLESTFGTIEDKSSLASAILGAARNATEDNIPDYIRDLLYSTNNSFLEELDEDIISSIYKKTVTNSVAYMTMERLGIDTEEYFFREDFEDIISFNTPETLNALGFATSDIAEMGLAEIAKTIMSLEKQNRIIAETRHSDYNVVKENQTERSLENDRIDLHDAGRLQTAQSDRTGSVGNSDGTLLSTESEVPEGKPQSSVLQSPDELQTERTPDGSGTDGNRTDGTLNERVGGERGRDGEPESNRYDELGATNEQHPQSGSGNGIEASSLRLDYYDRSNEDKSLPFFGGDDTIREILATTPHLKAGKDEIRAFFEANSDKDARVSYIKSIFNNDYTEVILSDERRVGYKTYQNVLHLWEGSYLNRTKQSFYDWGVIAEHFEAMRLLGELQDKFKPLPSIEGQMSLMLDYEAYEYHLGNTVYIGANEYEIQSFDDERVMLYDLQFPLFNKEMSRAEFDQKVRENPMNDHLKVTEKQSEKTAAPYDIGMGYLGNGLTVWNRAVEVNGDYQNIAHISPEGKITYYVQDLPHSIVERIEQAAEREKSHTDPNTTPIGDDDYYFHRPDVGEFEAVYYNPDAAAGGQFVFAHLPYDLIAEAKANTDSTDGFFEYLDEHAKTELVDLGTPEYDAVLEEYAAPHPERIGRSEDTMNTLVSQAESEITQESHLPQFYQDYLEIKTDNPNSLVLYQMGDFFEAYANDADVVGTALDLVKTTRSIDKNFRIPMVGFPQHRLETYLAMLTDRGFDVAISSLENGERKVYSVVSQNKEEPLESKPIGRIEYLGTNGEVGESIEYTSPYQLEKDIKEENYYGVPMNVVLYRQSDGSVVSHDYIAECDPPLKGFSVIDNPYLKSSLDIAKEIIDEYCREEFDNDEGADYTNLSKVDVAYTTTEDGKHEIQASVNLVDYRIETLVDGKVIRTEQYDTLEDMTEKGLKNLSFDDLVYLSEEEVGRVEKASETIVPEWEKPKKSKVQSFDLHPEIPMSERHNFDLANNEIAEVNKKERFHRNYAAISTLKKCQEENRFATTDEQKILSRYVGWGGIPEVFDERASSWQTEYGMLKNILSPEEYASARESTLTAFYTPPTVIKAVYKAMEQLGFREGNILEPSCGIGHFIGMLPDSMSASKIYGVELDTISAGIAQQLYQKTSIAAQGFEEANLPDSFFDAVVGNVPFGDFKVSDKRYDKYKFLIHDYFFAKSLDKLRPGGVMALITSKGTMDKDNPSVRKYIAQRADLLGAIRLPNNTFKGNAGTEVVSDILILQKRDRLIDIEPDWVHLGKDENGITMNSYFVEHPEMILGEMKMVSGRFGPEPSCVPYEGADLAEQLNEAISNIHGEIAAYEVDDELTEEDNSIPADPTVRNFSYTVVDDKIYFRENSRMVQVDVSATAENRIKGMISIRDAVRKLIELQTEDYPDSEIKAEQERLNSLYDTFTGKYGLLNSRANTSAFSQDSSFSLLSALEILNDEGNLERKADMFFKRTIKPHTPVTSVDTSSEALAVSMGEKACIDMEYMCQLSGKTEEEIYTDLKGVIFLNPMYGYGSSTEAKYLMADEYLSGNVREKLAVARKSAELYPEDYKVNVEALEKVQPKDLTASEISVRLGATWLPPEIVEQFIFEFLGTPRYAQWNIKLHFSEYTGEWNIEGKSYDGGNVKAYSTYGTKRINAYKIIEETLNLKDVRIFDYVEDSDGKKKAILNKKETAIAQAKQELIKQGFQDWIWAEPERRERLCKLYNEKFNSIRPREYDGSHITFNGMNPEIELREHQKKCGGSHSLWR